MNRSILARPFYETYVLKPEGKLPSVKETTQLLGEAHPFYDRNCKTDIRRIILSGTKCLLATVYRHSEDGPRSALYTAELLYASGNIGAPEQAGNMAAFSCPEGFEAKIETCMARGIRPLKDSIGRTTGVRKTIASQGALLFLLAAAACAFVRSNDATIHGTEKSGLEAEETNPRPLERFTFFRAASTVITTISESGGLIGSCSWESDGNRAAFAFSSSGCTAEDFRSRLPAVFDRSGFAIPETRFADGVPRFDCSWIGASYDGAKDTRLISEQELLELCALCALEPLSLQQGIEAICSGTVAEIRFPDFFGALASFSRLRGARVASCSITAPNRSGKTRGAFEIRLKLAGGDRPEIQDEEIDPGAVRKAFGIGPPMTEDRSGIPEAERQRSSLVGKIKYNGMPFAHFVKRPDGNIVCERTER